MYFLTNLQRLIILLILIIENRKIHLDKILYTLTAFQVVTVATYKYVEYEEGNIIDFWKHFSNVWIE